MIPKVIHYCWFGKGDMPELAQNCITSWHAHMPNWEFRLWSEDNFDITSAHPYVQEAYAAQKYAFVSDYVRLWALEREGGIYLDVDVEVLRPMDNLLADIAFIGMEESLELLPGTCVMGCEAHCQWVKDMLATYNDAHFFRNGSLDMTTNVVRLGKRMVVGGLQQYVREVQYLPQWGLRVYTHDYFSPITAARIMRQSYQTYAIHRFAGSWVEKKGFKWYNWWILRQMMQGLIAWRRIML